MLKRIFDLTASGLLLVLLCPILLVLGLLVRVRLGSPVLFAQDRPGINGRVFRMYKFRTMTDARDSRGRLLPDDDRLTPFGRALRASSADELPELWSVLKGDMSLVGPRPLLVEYLDLYSEDQARRHEVRPGITGLAQVRGRNALSWDDRLALDVWYVDHRSMWLDFRILVSTVINVLRRADITQPGSATCEPFMGARIAADGDEE